MSYIKQLEEANEKLMKSLERESMLRELETNRHKRWYRVEIRHIHNKHLHHATDAGDLCLRSPAKLTDDIMHTYDAPGMAAVRAIILSHLFMRKTEAESLLGAGVSWRIFTRNKQKSNGTWDPSVLMLEGWIVNSCKYPGWGGSLVSYWNMDSDSQISTRYNNYGEYARFVMDCQTAKTGK